MSGSVREAGQVSRRLLRGEDQRTEGEAMNRRPYSPPAPGTIVCNRCGSRKPKSEFPTTLYRISKMCRSCTNDKLKVDK